MSVHARIARTRRGDFSLRLSARERDVLRGLPDELRALLLHGDAADRALARLFPSADLDDPEHAAEFDSMVRDDLLQQRLASLDTLERTLDADRVSEDELVAWLAAVNDLRLVLGARLDVTEEHTAADFEGDELRETAYALYAFLSYLEEEVVEALSP